MTGPAGPQAFAAAKKRRMSFTHHGVTVLKKAFLLEKMRECVIGRTQFGGESVLIIYPNELAGASGTLELTTVEGKKFTQKVQRGLVAECNEPFQIREGD